MRRQIVALLTVVLFLVAVGNAWGGVQYAVTDLGTLGGGKSVARGINNSGQPHAFLLTPIPEPFTLALLGVGAIGLLGCVWRRRNRSILLAVYLFALYSPKPLDAAAPTLTEVQSFTVPSGISQMVYSDQYNLLFLRDSGTDVRVIDTVTQSQISLRAPSSATSSFSDFRLTPSGRYLYVADYGGTNIGYGTPSHPSYVHRYDLQTRTWDVETAPSIAYRIEPVDDQRVLLLEQDQWVDVTLNGYGGGTMTELARNGTDYAGNIEFDPKTGRIYHGNSGISSPEVNVWKLTGNSISYVQGTGTYGSANGYGGTAVLSSDAARFYYGRLQVNASDVTKNLNVFPELIYAGCRNFAFGSSHYYDPTTGAQLGTLAFTPAAYALGANAQDAWLVQQPSGGTATLHHYAIAGAPELATYYWIPAGGGTWATVVNWRPAHIPDGIDTTADFSQSSLSSDAVVTLDGNRTVAGLVFGDAAASHNWILNPGTGAALTLQVTSGSPLITVNNQTAAINAVIAGSQGLTKTGPGTLVLGMANEYAGITTINGGAVVVNADACLGAGGSLAINAGTLQVAGNITASRSIALGDAAAAIQVDDSCIYAATNDVVVTGTGGLTKTGMGTLDLTAATTGYSGATTVNGGAFLAGNLSNTAGIAVNAGTLNAIGCKSGATLSVAVAAAANLSAPDLTIGAVNNSGLLNFTATSGVITLAALSGAGTTNFSAGAAFPTLSAGIVNVAGPATITAASGGAANLNGPTASITTLSNATVNLGAGAALSVSGGTQTAGGIAGAGSLTKIGTSTLILAAANTYTGNTLISAGTLQVGNGGTAGNVAGNVTNNATLTFNRSDNYTFAGNIDGSGSLNQSGAGILTLTGTNTYAGSTKVNAGTLRIGAPGALVNGTALTISTSATLDLNGVDCTASAVTGAGTVALGGAMLTLNNAANTTLSVKVTGLGTMQKLGGGVLILTNANDYAGPTLISAGTLQIGSGGTAGNIAGNVADNAALTFNRSDAYVFAGSISGSGSVAKAGSGVTTLAGANSYGGGTYVDTGTLKLGAAGAYPAATALSVAAGATFDVNGVNAVVSEIAGSGAVALGAATLTVRSNANATVSASIGGSGGLVKEGSGDATLTANNTYTGPTMVSAGRLILPVDGLSASYTADAGAAVRVDHATMNLGSRWLRALAGGGVEYDGATLNGGYLRGPGTHTALPGGTNTFSGVTTYNSTVFRQNGPVLFRNFTNGGQVVNNAALTWDGGLNNGTGSLTVNNTLNVQDWSNQGLTTINVGGVINNSVSNIVGSGGQVKIQPGGQLNANSDGGGASFDLHNSLLVNNGAVSGALNVYYGALAKGAGTFDAVNVYDGGKFSPGNSPGSAATGSVSWNAGGRYRFEIDDAAGVAGVNWDVWNSTDLLSIAAGTTPNSRFVIELASLAGDNPGLAEHFDNGRGYRWLIAGAANGISGFDPAKLTVDASDFLNDLGGGAFYPTQSGNQLYLNFAPVPEPSTLVLLGIGAVSLAACAWRRRKRA